MHRENFEAPAILGAPAAHGLDRGFISFGAGVGEEDLSVAEGFESRCASRAIGSVWNTLET